MNRTGDIARPREAARERAALELIARHEQALKRTARRFSLDADDAEDAYQRALEIVLTKAPTTDPRELIRWTQTVTKHEALAVRRSRERLLGKQPLTGADGTPIDPLTLVPSPADGPGEQVERREEIARSREALRRLKPAELRALGLLAEGYSYAEIGQVTGFSHTKINRLLAEGRSRLRDLISSSEDGTRCRELRPLLSAFCDGEAKPADAEIVREHLRACAHCRATMRAYRAAPGLAGALVPALLPARSLLGRLHDAALRLGSQISGTGKLVIGCAVGTAGCVAVGVLPPPIPRSAPTRPPTERVVPLPREAAAAQASHRSRPKKARPKPAGTDRSHDEGTSSAIEAETAPEAIKYESAPAPAAPAEPVASSAGSESTSTESSGSAAGEFGP